MGKPQTIEEYKQVTGRRFRRTREQMKRGLDRDASFKEWLEHGSMSSSEDEKAKRPKDQPRIRRTKSEIKLGLTIEQALEERKEHGTLHSAREESNIIERSGYLCGHGDRNCQVPTRSPDFATMPNQCSGFKLTKTEEGTDLIINCICDCHRVAFEINKTER